LLAEKSKEEDDKIVFAHFCVFYSRRLVLFHRLFADTAVFIGDDPGCQNRNLSST
jgi:hypothetical protein